jgi:hypothetical protein
MSDAPQPTSGSLSAKLIRACPKHHNKCRLDCPRRKVEDLGEIASFQIRHDDTPPPEGSTPKWLRWFRTS